LKKTKEEMPAVETSSPDFAAVITELRGDLFDCGRDCNLAHCISADARMGKGIAVEFRRRFGYRTLQNDVLAQGKHVGDVAVVMRGSIYVYNLITKRNVWDKPTYADVRSALEAMRDHCLVENVSVVAMPRIGNIFLFFVKKKKQEN